MTLSVGTRLGNFEVLALLGAGGMGEVYRAHDRHLGRDVAIKVLPEGLVRDQDRLARFEREARVLASLNHSNIAVLHGLEESQGVRFLVMELIVGATLAELLAAGPLALSSALEAGRQIAEALECAHEKGVVHRDVKPANIKVMPSGMVKVLDFGLAKVLATAAASDDGSPTITRSSTREGTVVGTPAYMSPEQARGQTVDKRTDVWAFGAVVYETLTGRRAFAGQTTSDTITAILTGDPDWQALPGSTPVRIRELLRRCLQKDSHRRLRDLGDARIEIEEALAELSAGTPGLGPPHVPPAGKTAPRRSPTVAVLTTAAVLATAIAVWSIARQAPPAPPELRRFVIQPPPTATLSSLWNVPLALSPDGHRLVYVATLRESTQLQVRSRDEFDSRPLAGTEGAYDPFFSPDGQWVAFWAAGKLRKVSVAGGGAVTVCEASLLSGSWGEDGVIVLGSPAGLWSVSSQGGPPKAVSSVDARKGEVGHLWPEVLPGGEAVVFTIRTQRGVEDSRIAVQSLATGARRVLIEGGAQARYAPTGHLVYARSGSLFAVPFDARKLELTGPSVPVLDNVLVGHWNKVTQFAFADDGSLAYVPHPQQQEESSLVWVDRKGSSEPLPLPSRPFLFPRLSPDGRSLVVQIPDGAHDVLWVNQLGHDPLRRLTFEGSNSAPVWTPDGKRLTFSSTAGGGQDIFWQPADGSAPPQRLLATGKSLWPESWTADGRTLVFTQEDAIAATDIGLFHVGSDAAPESFIAGPADQFGSRLSPDGRWISYLSEESGRFEVYLRPFPGPGSKRQVSTEGGTEAVWAASGRELFYRSGEGLMAVAVATNPALSIGKPSLLFAGPFASGAPGLPNYDVTPDGRRFLMVKPSDDSASPPIHVVEGWFEELKRRVPPAR